MWRTGLGILFLLALGPADEVVGGAVGKILQRLDAVLAHRDHHRRGDALDLGNLVGNAELAALGVAIGFLLLEVFARTRLDLVGGVLVETFDVRDLRQVDEGDLLDRGEAFGHQQLGDDLVDVERLHEHVRALGEFLLAALGLFLLGEDVDVPAGELRGEAHVLAAAADGQRQLALRHDDLDAVGVFVEHDLGDLGGRQAR